jgi:hypothetical protein
LWTAVETWPILPAFLDDIANLQDANMFAAIMEAEWAARKPAKDSKPEPIKSASAMARVVSTKWVFCSSSDWWRVNK